MQGLEHLDSSQPELSGYTGFPPAVVSPFFEARSCFFETDDGGFASRHVIPPRRKTQRKNDLNSYRRNTSNTLAENSQYYGVDKETADLFDCIIDKVI